MTSEKDAKLWSVLHPPSWAFSRSNFWGSLMFNLGTSVLPPLYQMLSTVYLAEIDSSTIGTVATYTYLGVIGKLINEGLPRASYRVLGSQRSDHFASMCTLMIFQMVASFLLALAMSSFAPFLSDQFAAVEIQQATVDYIRISAWSVFFGCIEYAGAIGLRALDHPDIPLITMLTKVAVNMILDFLFLSSFRVVDIATTSTQAFVRLSCDATAAVAIVVLYSWRTGWRRPQFGIKHLVKFGKFGGLLFLESVVRNCVYLACIKEIVKMGKDYGAAWSNFNTIRWGIIMCVTLAAEGSASAFVGHRWHRFDDSRTKKSEESSDNREDLKRSLSCSLDKLHLNTELPICGPFYKHGWFQVSVYIAVPALCCCVLVFLFELAIYIFFSVGMLNRYALWTCGGDAAVAELTITMWSRINWTYILWAVTLQLTSILTATAPKWTVATSAFLDLVWILPWTLYLALTTMEPSDAWKTTALIFGGVNVLNIFVVSAFLGLWLCENKKKFAVLQVCYNHRKNQADLLLEPIVSEDVAGKDEECHT